MDIFSKTVLQKHGKTYKKDETIFSEGDPCREMFIISEGKVRIVKQEHGENIYLSTLGPGEFLGDMADGSQPRYISAVAATPCTLVSIDSDTFSSLAKDNPSLAWKIIKRLDHRLRIMNEKLLTALNKDDPTRLAQVLLEWTQDLNRPKSFEEKAIASEAGMHLSVASRLMKHLGTCDVLDADGPGRWVLKDAEGLRDFGEYCIRKRQMDPLGMEELAHLAGIKDDEARLLAIRAIEKRIGSRSSTVGDKGLMTPLQRYLKLKLRFELTHGKIEGNKTPQEMPT